MQDVAISNVLSQFQIDVLGDHNTHWYFLTQIPVTPAVARSEMKTAAVNSLGKDILTVLQLKANYRVEYGYQLHRPLGFWALTGQLPH